MLIRFFSIKLPLPRILLYTLALMFFIFWTDQYCMWIFGIMEGYPLMHPLLVLARHPLLLSALPILGKHVLLLFFLVVPVSITLLAWYKNYASLVLCTIVIMPWILCALAKCVHEKKQPVWYKQMKSLPCMIRAHNAKDALHILVRHIKKLMMEHPETTIIVMPESALDMIDEKDLYVLSEKHIGKKLHIVFGSCYYQDGCHYNALYYVYDGVLQARFDKKHAMLITERLCDWMNCAQLRKIYFKNDISITCSCNIRIPLQISPDFAKATSGTQGLAFVPYICSELFFNEYPDDCYDAPIIAIVNDTLFMRSYLQELIFLLTCLRAVQWQRDIVYIAYGKSVLIDKLGIITEIS